MSLLFLALPALLLLACPVRAEVPGMEAQGLLARTNPEAVRVSPLWGMVALHSGVLQNIRFHGHYGAQPDPRFPRHLDLVGASDCPRDAVAGVLQHLFPCPDGVNFDHNERDKDPIGLIAQEQREARQARHPGPRPGGLGKILALLDATLDYQRILAQSPHGGHPAADADFQAAVFRILDRRSKSADLDPPASHFNVLRNNFASLMQQAVLEEARDTQGRYPPDTVPVALLAYAWKAANGVEELYAAFGGHLLDGPEPKEHFGARQYWEDRPRFQERLATSLRGAALDAEDLAMNLFGLKAYEGIVPERIASGIACYRKVSFPDCGETTLRNFFNIAFSDGGALDPRRIDTFCAQFTGPGGAVAGLRDYYRDYPTLAAQATEPERSHLAAGKLDRLCALVSIPPSRITWRGPVPGDERALPSPFPTLDFAIGGRPAFSWHFMDRHFSMVPKARPDLKRWPLGMACQPSHPWLQLWLRANRFDWSRPAAPLRPFEIYSNNLRDPEEVASVLESILATPPGPMWGIVGQLCDRCLPLDPQAFYLVILALHDNPGFMKDPQHYPLASLKAWPQDRKDQMLLSTFAAGLPYPWFISQARFWLDHGADLAARDILGRSARDLHWLVGLPDAASLLEALGEGETETL